MIILGQYITKSNKNNLADYAIGMNYPYTMTKETFDKSYTNIEALRANVFFLKTIPGERVFSTQFGTNLHSLLFEPNNDDIEEKIFKSINDAVRKWIPQLSIQSIEVSNTDLQRDNNTVTVNITFSAPYVDKDFTVSVDYTGKQ